MFKKGDYIVYGSTGICEVVDVTTMHMDGIPNDKLYYILHPYNKKGSEIFTPVDNKRTVMRNIIPPLKAKELLEGADVILSKGQGNFETMHGCGLNVYYSFLCKDSLPLKDTSFNTVVNNFKTVEKTAS